MLCVFWFEIGAVTAATTDSGVWLCVSLGSGAGVSVAGVASVWSVAVWLAIWVAWAAA